MIDIQNIIKRIKEGDLGAIQDLPGEYRSVVEQSLQEITTGNTTTYDNLYLSDFEQKPPTIDEFANDTYYYGNIERDDEIFDVWMKELRIIHNTSSQINEAIFRGGVGTAKTSMAVFSLLYRMCWIQHLRNPQKFLNKLQGSPIVVGLFNIFKYLAQSTAYKLLNNWMKIIPFFKDILPRRWGHKNDLRSEYIDLPKGMTIALGSSAIHALGQDLLLGLLDEGDFNQKDSATAEEKSKIEDLYSQAKIRATTRFLQANQVDYSLLILCSQVRDIDSFMATHIEKVKNDNTTHVVSFALWDVKEKVFEGQPRFQVAIGDKTKTSFIVSEDEDLPNDMLIIDVPEGLRQRFEYNIDDAIRDLAGVPTYGYRLLFPRRDKLIECYENSTPREHPFTKETIELSLDDDIQIMDFFYKEAILQNLGIDRYKPKFFPQCPRAIHLDLSKNQDCTGFAMACISEIKHVKRFTREGVLFNTQDANVFIDIMLEIKAKKGSEIDYGKIRSFIFFLIDCGFNIVWVSADNFNSVDSQQIFYKSGIKTKIISVDKSVGPYYGLKQTTMEGRLDIYEYVPFTEQFTKLQDLSDIKGKKPPIDHPKKFKKDLSDAVCGVNQRLSEEKDSPLQLVQPEIMTHSDIQKLTGTIKEKDKVTKIKEWMYEEVKQSSKNPMESLFDD